MTTKRFTDEDPSADAQAEAGAEGEGLRLDLDRRQLLKCGAWAGAGLLWALAGGVPKVLRLTEAAAAAALGGLQFVQISDSHIGFNKDANPDAPGTLAAAIALVRALPTPA